MAEEATHGETLAQQALRLLDESANSVEIAFEIAGQGADEYAGEAREQENEVLQHAITAATSLLGAGVIAILEVAEQLGRMNERLDRIGDNVLGPSS